MTGLYRWIRNWVTRAQTMTSAGYWDRRARQFGRRAVYNIGHHPGELDSVDIRQKTLLLPILRRHLQGSERAALDLGCGVGRFSAELAELVRGPVTAVDVSRELLALAPAAKNVSYVLASGTQLPLPDESFDLIWVCLLLGAIRGAEVNDVCREIERVSRRGSLLVLVENTSLKEDAPSWSFRGVDEYVRLLPIFHLEVVTSYDDLGETISVLVGRRD